MRRLSVILLFCCVALVAYSGNRELDRIVSEGNVAYLLSQRDKILKAATDLDKALRDGLVSGNDSIEYSVSMLKLYGNYHYENISLDSTSSAIAEEYYLRAKDVMAHNSSVSFHLNLKMILDQELAQLYYRGGSYAKALECTESAFEYMYDGDIADRGDVVYSDLLLQQAMCKARLGRFDEAISDADTAIYYYPKTEALGRAKAKRMKAKILILSAKNPQEALSYYRSYFSTQKSYAEENFSKMSAAEREQYWLALRPFIADCYQLEAVDASFLYDVTLFSKGLLLQLSRLSGDDVASAGSIRSLNYSWTDIQKVLKRGEAAIEFVEYEKGGVQKMAALLLKPTGKPQFIALTNPADVLNSFGGELQSTNRRGKDKLYTNETLQKMVWSGQLLSAIGGASTLYFAPDGYLHRVAIEYMPQVEAFDMCRLTSTRRLMEHCPFSSAQPMLLCGRVNYDYNRESANEGENDSVAFAAYRNYSFPRLSSETDETSLIMSERANAADTLLATSSASESAFRTLAPQYGSIMVSTHGDFRTKSLYIGTDIKPVLSDEAMSENIIAFSGINSTLKDSKFDATSRYDGLLSARELSTLNLSKCGLFTISACQTALGQITSDGVFGLQRGLKNAGVGAMLLSLWSVDSTATSRLMSEFYKNLNSGKSVRTAFKEARKSLMVVYDKEEEYTYYDAGVMANVTIKRRADSYETPQYTDAFILIDALEK